MTEIQYQVSAAGEPPDLQEALARTEVRLHRLSKQMLPTFMDERASNPHLVDFSERQLRHSPMFIPVVRATTLGLLDNLVDVKEPTAKKLSLEEWVWQTTKAVDRDDFRRLTGENVEDIDFLYGAAAKGIAASKTVRKGLYLSCYRGSNLFIQTVPQT